MSYQWSGDLDFSWQIMGRRWEYNRDFGQRRKSTKQCHYPRQRRMHKSWDSCFWRSCKMRHLYMEPFSEEEEKNHGTFSSPEAGQVWGVLWEPEQQLAESPVGWWFRINHFRFIYISDLPWFPSKFALHALWQPTTLPLLSLGPASSAGPKIVSWDLFTGGSNLQLRFRSTGQSAAWQPVLVVILMGKLNPSTRETTNMIG